MFKNTYVSFLFVVDMSAQNILCPNVHGGSYEFEGNCFENLYRII